MDNVKQFDKLIKCYAASDLPNKNIKLLILGDGDYKNELVKLVKNLNLQENIVV